MGLLEVNGKNMVGKLDLRKNGDLLKSSSFQLRHARPGTVSLNLGKNSDDDFYRNRPGYVELGFLITTGPRSGAVVGRGEHCVRACLFRVGRRDSYL